MDDETRKPSNVYAQSFARGLEVIRSFEGNPQGLTLSEVSKRVAVTRATARRLLHTLVALGYAVTDGKYFSLTPKVMDLGYSYLTSSSIWGASEQYVEQLVAKVGESASVSVLENTDVVYVLRVPTERILKSTLSVGSRLPAHVVSMGRIQLAALTDEALDAYLSKVELKSYTQWTALRAQIIEDRNNGWSMVSRELEEGIAGIAVPILSRSGRVIAAINVSLYPAKLEVQDNFNLLLSSLHQTAQEIGRAVDKTSRSAG